VTDGQTDRRTDRILIARPRLHACSTVKTYKHNKYGEKQQKAKEKNSEQLMYRLAFACCSSPAPLLAPSGSAPPGYGFGASWPSQLTRFLSLSRNWYSLNILLIAQAVSAPCRPTLSIRNGAALLFLSSIDVTVHSLSLSPSRKCWPGYWCRRRTAHIMQLS